MGPCCHADNLGHQLLFLTCHEQHLGCLLLLQCSLFLHRCITPLKQAVRGRLRGRGWGSIWDEWDTFMEYCMLNNRLREGVMSLSRKHKHYVLIRRLIINKVQGRCSETKLFSLVFIRTKSSFNRVTEKHSAAIINRHYHFYWLLGNSFALLTSSALKGQALYSIFILKSTNQAKTRGEGVRTPRTFTCQPSGKVWLMEWNTAGWW